VGDAIQGELELEDERPVIRTEDGTLWQLPDDAVDRVLELEPEEGRRIVGAATCWSSIQTSASPCALDGGRPLSFEDQRGFSAWWRSLLREARFVLDERPSA
jgi:hypothetical protein